MFSVPFRRFFSRLPNACRLLALVCLLFGLVPAPSHGYGVFQLLRHVETGFDGLDAPNAAAVSPDGRHAYVVGPQSILVAERQEEPGEWITVQTLKEDVLEGYRLQHVAMAPDGLNLYAAGSFFDSALLVFSRDPDSGHLTHLQTLRSSGSADVISLVLLSDLVVTEDGRFLYTAAPNVSALGFFRRHLGDGTLELVDEVVGDASLPALQYPKRLELSPDAAQLFVVDRDGGLLIFARNPDDGSLTLQDTLGLDVLAPMEPADVEVDPSGQSLYLSGSAPDQRLLYVFRRDSEGDLTRTGTLEDLPGNAGLHIDASGSHLYMAQGRYVTVFARSPQGQLEEIQRLRRIEGSASAGTFDSMDRFLYMPDPLDDQLGILERNPASGEVAPVVTYFDGQDGTVDGLLDIEALYATADGTDLYSLTQENKAIAQFRRDEDGVLQRGQVLSLTDLGLHPQQEVRGWLATPDDRHLIAVTPFDGLWTFQRDTITGLLQFVGQQEVGSRLDSDFAFSPDGRTLLVAASSRLSIWNFDPATGLFSERAQIDSPEQAFGSIDVGPEGRFVYAGSTPNIPGEFGRVRVFLWEQAPDRLTLVEEDPSPVLGGEVSGLHVTPDGKHVLAAGKGDGAGLLVFERDSRTGGLTEIQSLVDGQNGLTGFREPILGSMDPSGVRVVVTSELFPITTSTFLGRDPSTGQLEILEQRATGDSSRPSGIDTYGGLAWSPDGRQFYAFSTVSDILFAFDETAQTGCVPRPQVLCLGNAGRFRAEVQWTDFTGQQGIGTKVVESGDSGLFWFFDPANWEMLVKVVDGCDFNGHHWVFAAATTNVAYTLTVTDTLRGAEAIYQNPLGTSSAAITDTEALNSCP